LACPPTSGCDGCARRDHSAAPVTGDVNRRDAIQPAFDVLLGVVDDVLPVDRSAVERSKTIVLARQQLSARAAVHLAIMEQHGIQQILSFDAGFDGLPGVTRLFA
jgi:uncharacterized protein